MLPAPHHFSFCVPLASQIHRLLRAPCSPYSPPYSLYRTVFPFPSTLLTLYILFNTAPAVFSCSTLRALLGCREPFQFGAAPVNNVLGSCVQARKTNSSRPGFNLRGRRSNSASSRGRQKRGARHGRHSFRKRHSLASRRWQPRETPHPRTLCFPSAQTARK